LAKKPGIKCRAFYWVRQLIGNIDCVTLCAQGAKPVKCASSCLSILFNL
jgi:hypothetical protein